MRGAAPTTSRGALSLPPRLLPHRHGPSQLLLDRHSPRPLLLSALMAPSFPRLRAASWSRRPDVEAGSGEEEG